MPNLYIIAGCNGAGKTTASFNVLPGMLDCDVFVNADAITHGISPFSPEEVAIQAEKIMLARIDKLIAQEEILPLKQRCQHLLTRKQFGKHRQKVTK